MTFDHEAGVRLALAAFNRANGALSKDDPTYDQRWKVGDAFEDYVIAQLHRLGRTHVKKIVGRAHQILFGDTNIGWEIKCDRLFKGSGYLFIETMERSQKPPHHPVESGIYRRDACGLYAIGNTEELYVYTKQQLREHLEKYNRASERIVERHRFNGLGSGMGFRLEPHCLPHVEAHDWSARGRIHNRNHQLDLLREL